MVRPGFTLKLAQSLSLQPLKSRHLSRSGQGSLVRLDEPTLAIS